MEDNNENLTPLSTPALPASKKWYQHTGLVLGIVLVILVAGLAAGAYWMFSQPEVAEQNSVLTTDTQPKNYLVIKEWGVEFEKPSGMSDLEYGAFGITDNTMTFITPQLMQLDQTTGGKYCVADQAPIGVLSRVENFDSFKDSGHFIPENVKIGAYYYFFTPPQATCSDNKQVQGLTSQQLTALSATVLKTLRDSNNISNWKTFTSTEYGFEFKHPSDWDTKNIELAGPLDGYQAENPPAGVSFRYNTKQGEWVSIGVVKASPAEMPIPQVTPSGIKWFFTGIADGLGGSFHSFIPDSQNNIMINLWSGWGTACVDENCPEVVDPSIAAKQELMDIMATFKFTDPSTAITRKSEEQVRSGKREVYNNPSFGLGFAYDAESYTAPKIIQEQNPNYNNQKSTVIILQDVSPRTVSTARSSVRIYKETGRPTNFLDQELKALPKYDPGVGGCQVISRAAIDSQAALHYQCSELGDTETVLILHPDGSYIRIQGVFTNESFMALVNSLKFVK